MQLPWQMLKPMHMWWLHDERIGSHKIARLYLHSRFQHLELSEALRAP